MLKNFTIYNGGVKLFFGLNVVEEMSNLIEQSSRILIVMGKRSAKVSGAFYEVISVLKNTDSSIEVWDKAEPNPTDRLVEELKTILNENFQYIIAIGGGSVIDLAKASRVLYSCGGSIREYLYGVKRVCRDLKPPLIAVNLTHGTGSEIDRYSVVTLTDTREKIGFNAGYPYASFDDPRYTVSLSRNHTIYVTMDAFAHAVESATSRFSSPYTELLARETIDLIVKYLPRALENPTEITYRYWLMYASMLAGISIDHGVTHIGHGLEHVLTGLNPNLPHGAGLAILYKELIGLIYRGNPVTMAKILKPLDPSLTPEPSDAEKARRAYIKFLDVIGFYETLSDYGFSIDSVKEIQERYSKLAPKRYEPLSPFEVKPEEIAEIVLSLL
ncbi:MAG: iron-containing alcohol dehydrogenase [Desulfurococcaceae archaeon]